MFDQRSRYRDTENAVYTADSGQVIVYRRRRILPRVEDMQMRGMVNVIPNERVDHLTARTLGDPLQYWQLCDANPVMNPAELLSESSGSVKVPQPQFTTTR